MEAPDKLDFFTKPYDSLVTDHTLAYLTNSIKNIIFVTNLKSVDKS